MIATRMCADCGADLSGSNAQTQRCKPCAKKRRVDNARERHQAKVANKTCQICDADMSHMPSHARFCEVCAASVRSRNGRLRPSALYGGPRQCTYPGCERYGTMYGVFHRARRRWIAVCWTDADRLLNGPMPARINKALEEEK